MERFRPLHPIASLRSLDPNVRSLGLVSFFADLSSEIAYPLFPIFVTTVLGVPVALLGVIEGMTKYFYPEASNTVMFVLMVLVLLVKPSGLTGRAN